MSKRLYTVTVSFEFAVLAEDENDALSYTDEALADTGSLEENASAQPLSWSKWPAAEEPKPIYPAGWDHKSLVYGNDKGEDVTMAQAIELERTFLAKERAGAKEGSLGVEVGIGVCDSCGSTSELVYTESRVAMCICKDGCKSSNP